MKPQLVEHLCRRLRRHGLSLRYVARVRTELTDHYICAFDECIGGGMSDVQANEHAQSRLGDADELFEAIVSRREQDSIVRRHPFITFALLPVPIAATFAIVLSVVGRAAYLFVQRKFGVHYLDSTFVAVVGHSFYLAAYGVTPLVALYFCRLATLYRCPISFAFISCLTLCLVGGVLKLDLVQCLASGSVKYFQRYGWDNARLSLPLATFAVHSIIRFARQGRRVPILHV